MKLYSFVLVTTTSCGEDYKLKAIEAENIEDVKPKVKEFLYNRLKKLDIEEVNEDVFVCDRMGNTIFIEIKNIKETNYDDLVKFLYSMAIIK
jgi:hypothetical protein